MQILGVGIFTIYRIKYVKVSRELKVEKCSSGFDVESLNETLISENKRFWISPYDIKAHIKVENEFNIFSSSNN